MDSVAPVRALNRRSTQSLQLGFVLLALGFFLGIVGLVIVTIPLLATTHPLYGLFRFLGGALIAGGVLLAIAGLVLALRAVLNPKDNPLALETGQFLGQHLDGRYSYIRNINRSGLGYIDAVLLGPPGVLVFRIVGEAGVFGNEAASWLRQEADQTWTPHPRNFTKEAVTDVQAIRRYLAKRGMAEVPVFGVVVFTNSGARLVPREPVVPVTLLPELMDSLQSNYMAKLDRIQQATVTAVRRLLLS